MNKAYKLHSTFVFFCFCIVYVIIVLKLYLIQIHHNSFFAHLAEQQYQISVTTYPSRALIFDRSKTHCLALNQDCVSAFILPKKLKNPERVASFLQEHFPAAYERLQQHQNSNFMYIKRKLTEQHLALLEKEHLDDIQLLTEPNRFYPVAAAASVVGITDIDNKGIFGIELHYDKVLVGEPFLYHLERDARSGHFYFKREMQAHGKEGTPITLTLDGDLQFLAHEELKESIQHCNAQEGSVLIMDPRTGEILTMANYPSFNPNDSNDLILEHTKNKIVTECYELGSVIKTFAALAALEEGVVQPDELIDCRGAKTAYIDGRKINTWKAHGTIPFTQVIEESNNIGIALVAKRLGPKIYDHYTRLGFGQRTQLGFPGEQTGHVNPPWNWSKQSIISLSYGYEISATLLQLGRAFSIIANGGYDIQPKLIMDGVQPALTKRLFAQSAITTLQTVLENTTQRGTARRAAIEGYRIMSKTGTANLLVNGAYDHTKNIYTCAGIIERDTYQRVLVVFVKEAQQANAYAATIAVPLFERIAKKMVIHDRIIS